MGLDWNPANKPLPGHAREAATLGAAIVARPTVEDASDRWNLYAIAGAAVLTLVAWALGWVVNPVRTGFALCALLLVVGWPLYARARGIPPRAAVVFLTSGIWHPIGAYGLPVLVAVRGGQPLTLSAPAEGTMSAWIGLALHDTLPVLLALLPVAGVWAYGWRYFDPRRVRHAITRDALRERFLALSVPAYTTVGAPVVGRDAAADAWAAERIRAAADGPLSEDELRARLDKARGYHVLQLAPPCDGLPIYTNAPLNPHLERVSFRGAFLKSCEEVLGKELLERAWEPMEPDALVVYGEALLARGRAYAEAQGIADIDHLEAPEDLESPEARAHIVVSAGRWCVYWGKRGHGLDPWF